VDDIRIGAVRICVHNFRYKDVEAVVDSLNNAFSKMVFCHQSIYMMLMCTLFYTPIRHLKILPVEGSTLFAIIALYYCVRLFIFFPAMGRLNAQSHTFVESWMEGKKEERTSDQLFRLR
jgi:hypothetical protein